MKIGLIVNNLEVSGGYQKLVIRLAQELIKKGHKVVIYTLRVDKENCYPDDIKNLRIILPDSPSSASLATQFSELARKIGSGYQALIIQDELSLMAIGALSLPRSTKVVWMLNNQLNKDDGRYFPELPRMLRQPNKSARDKNQDLVNAYKRISLMRKGLRRVDDFVTYDRLNKELVKKYLRRKAQIVYAGADLAQFKLSSKNRQFASKKSYRVLSVGVVFPHRRYEDLIRSIALLRKKGYKVTATIVGRQDQAPEYYAKLVTLVKKLDLGGSVHFLSYISDDEMIKLYKGSDLFAFINDGFTWGVAAFEAVAAKLPLIITSNIGAADLIENGKNGWVVEPKSPKDVAKAIADIIDHPKETEKIVEKAFDEMMNLLSWQAYAERMIKVIDGTYKE